MNPHWKTTHLPRAVLLERKRLRMAWAVHFRSKFHRGPVTWPMRRLGWWDPFWLVHASPSRYNIVWRDANYGVKETP